MIQKLIGMPKDDIEIILKLHQLHHQLNIDHDILVLQYITCSLVSMFILINDESNILIVTFWHCIWPLIFFFLISKCKKIPSF